MQAFLLFINDVHGMGLKRAEGLLLTKPFCWDMDHDTRQALRGNAGQDTKRQPGRRLCVHAGVSQRRRGYRQR
jgi:hypothetical protein